jgi:hypothetical protein
MAVGCQHSAGARRLSDPPTVRGQTAGRMACCSGRRAPGHARKETGLAFLCHRGDGSTPAELEPRSIRVIPPELLGHSFAVLGV